VSESQIFRLSPTTAQRLEHQPFKLEKDLQRLFEAHLPELLGVRFLETEWTTTAGYAGRIDTVGLDENNNPVIIEYKRDRNENVINQGLFYLDWLVNHQADFLWLVKNKINEETAKQVDWSSPRLICIAESFGKYDAYAVKQIKRNIQLVQYRHYEELLVLDLVTEGSLGRIISQTAPNEAPVTPFETAEVRRTLQTRPSIVQELFAALESHVFSFGEDIELKELKLYFAFRKLKNFICVTPQSDQLILWLKLNPDQINLPDFASIKAKDVRQKGHWGTGDLELELVSLEDLETAKPLLEKAYFEN
jgi:predicted transport protein/RecB family endonuclease NucS